MVGYDGWTPNAVCMHVAFDSPIAMRPLLKQAFGVAFIQCNRRVVIGTVLGSNERALKLDRHMGFREVGRVRDGWARGVDLVMLELRKEDWLAGRLNARHGRNQSHLATDNAGREAA